MALHRIEKLDLVKLIFYGALVDTAGMYAIWPIAGQPIPSTTQATLMIIFGILVGLGGIIFAHVKSRKRH